MITEKIINLLNILPDASYWETCFINYYNKPTLDIALLPVDFFYWFSTENHDKYYYCLIPDYDVFWFAILKLYCDALDMDYKIFHKELIKHIISLTNTFSFKMIRNISIERINWLIKLKKEDIPEYDIIIDGIKNALCSKLQQYNCVDKDTIEKFKEKCRKDSELQVTLLEELSQTSSSRSEQQNS